MTATKPLIFTKNDCIELLDEEWNYFKLTDLNRTKIIPKINALSIDEFFNEFKKTYDVNKSYVVVFNTIKSSIIFFNLMKENMIIDKKSSDEEFIYLSTNIPPFERIKRIKRIRKLIKENKKLIVVSTQLIEAGVDIDFDIAIRDIGPIDSIIQIAGRCNRNKGKETGEVYIFHLKDNGEAYSKKIYKTLMYNISLSLLGKKIEEKDFYNLINSYFIEVSKRKDQSESIEIIEAIKELRFKHQIVPSISDFKLIDDRGGYVNIFVELNKRAQCIWKYYIKNVKEETDFRKKQKCYLRIKRLFKSYIISAPLKSTQGLQENSEKLYYVPHELRDTFYDEYTGFKRFDDISIFF